MNTATTAVMIDAAKKVADAVASTPGVISSRVDDWGTFGNFSLFVSVAERADVDLRAVHRALKVAVKRLAPGAKLRSVIMPKRIYSGWDPRRRHFSGWNSDGRKFVGRGEISISLDFHRFDPTSNSFPAIQPSGPFELGAWGKAAISA